MTHTHITISSRRLAAGAASAITFFVVCSVILPLHQAGRYHIVRQAISELALGSWGWLQNLAFAVLGFGTIALGLALRSTIGAGVAPVLLAIAAALDIVSAIFHTVPSGHHATVASGIHMAAGIATFLLTYAAMFSTIRPFRATPGLRSWAPATAVWAALGVVTFIVCAPPSVGVSHFGIGQRIMAATFLSWMLAVAVRLASRPDIHNNRPTQPGPAVPATGRAEPTSAPTGRQR